MKRLLLLFLFPLALFAQGGFITQQTAFKTVNGQTFPIPGATVTVCAGGAIGLPCAPALSSAVFKDAALTQPLSNPFTADVNGNYQFAIAPGTYTVTVTASGFTGNSSQVTVSCIGSCTFGNTTIAGTLTVSGAATLGALTAPSAAISGAFTTGTLNNTCIANSLATFNACIALGSNTDINIVANFTITSQVLINNLTNVRIAGSGTGFLPVLTNGITGAAAACAIKITGTSEFIKFQNFQVVGNNTTGAGGNGNGICINGTGNLPAFIAFDNVWSQFNKGTGVDGTGASINAAGLYVYKAIDIFVNGGSFGSNQYGFVADVLVKHMVMTYTSANQNLVRALWVRNNGQSIKGAYNDWETNAVNTTDDWILMDGCDLCQLTNNYFEGNNGLILYQSTSSPGQEEFGPGNIMHHSGVNPSGSFFMDSDGPTDLFVHDNHITFFQSMTSCIDLNPSTNAGIGKRIDGNIFDTSNGTVSGNCINWQAGTHAGRCELSHNSFGSTFNTVFTGTTAVNVAANANGCEVIDNSATTSSGTLGNIVTINSGATNTHVAGTRFSGAGSFVNIVNDSGTNTFCEGGGCSAPLSFTGISQFSGNKAVLTADWTCGTGGTVSSCVAATIIGSGGGVPLTFALPLTTAAYQMDCDLVVGQATAATANQWNLLTATNGATNVTANYIMGTAATAMAVGAVTDQASTTTTFQIAPSWTLGGTATKMPVHIHAAIESPSASGTVVSLQLVAPTVADLVTIYRGSACRIY